MFSSKAAQVEEQIALAKNGDANAEEFLRIFLEECSETMPLSCLLQLVQAMTDYYKEECKQYSEGN